MMVDGCVAESHPVTSSLNAAGQYQRLLQTDETVCNACRR